LQRKKRFFLEGALYEPYQGSRYNFIEMILTENILFEKHPFFHNNNLLKGVYLKSWFDVHNIERWEILILL
jgi:hypothetical protein